jgi:cytochrome P450
MPEGRTIFHEIMQSDGLPETEKETQRIADEAMVILFAGTDTTASTLTAIMYHMLADGTALARLKAELASAMPDPQQPPDAATLDKLAYLNAVIHEALRLYPGATHRQDRAAPDEDLVYRDENTGRVHVIPAGTGVGMAAPIVNRNPAVYHRPDEFLPDRFIQDPTLSRHSISFSKGARQCLGMHLAYQEMQTFVAGIFRQYDVYDPSGPAQGPTLELYQTSERDIAMDADYVTPAPFVGSKGVRIVVRR